MIYIGWNALSPHTNLTMFQQLEPWTDSVVAEMNTCTWDAVMKGKSVSGCRR